MSTRLPFLSVVVIVQNRSHDLEHDLRRIRQVCQPRVSALQLLVVENGSKDGSVAQLRQLTLPGRTANVQVLALGTSVDFDTAAWVGLDRAIGDFAVVVAPGSDELGALGQIIDAAGCNTDVVYAHAALGAGESTLYRLLIHSFYLLYRWSAGVDLAHAPRYRLLSSRVINFIHQHPSPAAAYRHLPHSAGFDSRHLMLTQPRGARQRRPLREDFSRGWAMLMSSSRGPMRVVTTLSLFGAGANLLYSVYVILVGIFKAQVAPGWVTLSLQMSGMFLLISLTLLILGEYVLHITRLAHQGPAYLVAQEFSSAEFSRQQPLNIQTDNAGSLHA
ncbi:hypothetical protein [Deinococcus sp. UYEF24]